MLGVSYLLDRASQTLEWMRTHIEAQAIYQRCSICALVLLSLLLHMLLPSVSLAAWQSTRAPCVKLQVTHVPPLN